MAYRFIDDYKALFGTRWLLHRLDIYPNAYYNDRKHRKAAYREEKQRIKKLLENGEKRYNCTIVDLHDRSVIASITDRHMTADLAVRTIRKAIESQPEIKGVLILHSDQGSQYTSNEFVEYCERMRVTQSMSKAGYPYDNTPMERYFNTLKNDLIHEHSYKTEDELYRSIEEYAYVTYNHARPHSYNGYKTPFEARYIA